MEREREPQNTAGMGRRRGREVEMEKLCNEEGGEEGRKGRESLMITEKRKEGRKRSNSWGKEGQGRKREWTEKRANEKGRRGGFCWGDKGERGKGRGKHRVLCYERGWEWPLLLLHIPVHTALLFPLARRR